MDKKEKEKILRGVLWTLGIIALLLIIYGIAKIIF